MNKDLTHTSCYIIHLVTPEFEECTGNSTGFRMKILPFVDQIAKRYASFDFSNIPVFPNLMPDTQEWGNYLPKFKGDNWEIPAKHLLYFHECMHQLNIVHEYV